jgi:hypothetical protein
MAMGAVLVGLSGGPVAADDVSVAATPPVVVETTPRAGAVNVDPSLAEIRVTFSKDMMTR